MFKKLGYVVEDLGYVIEDTLYDVIDSAVNSKEKNEIVDTYLGNDKTIDYNITYGFGNDLIINNLIMKQGEVLYLPMKKGKINIKVAAPLPFYIKGLLFALNTLEKFEK